MNKAALVLAVLLTASMAAATPYLTVTTALAQASNNANGTPIISLNQIWDVLVGVYDSTGSTTGSWEVDLRFSGGNSLSVSGTITRNGQTYNAGGLWYDPPDGDAYYLFTGIRSVINQMLANPGIADTVVDTEANAENYDAPTHPTVTNRKNDGYDMHGDTWLSSGWMLAEGADFTPAVFDGVTGQQILPNIWDLHVVTTPGVDCGNMPLTQIALKVVPEPASMSLLAVSGLALLRRQRH